MQSYNEYLVKQIENTNVEFERFMKNRNYTLTIVTIVTGIFTVKTYNLTNEMIVVVSIITMLYLLAILSINFKIRYIDDKNYYNDEDKLLEYLVACNKSVSDCYNKMFMYTVVYALLIILVICLNTVNAIN